MMDQATLVSKLSALAVWLEGVKFPEDAEVCRDAAAIVEFAGPSVIYDVRSPISQNALESSAAPQWMKDRFRRNTTSATGDLHMEDFYGYQNDPSPVEQADGSPSQHCASEVLVREVGHPSGGQQPERTPG